MSGIYHKNKVWANVTIPNPQDAATADLEKVKIDGTTYAVGGADTLSDLTDTIIIDPSNGEVLEYDGSAHKWRNGAKKADNDVLNRSYQIVDHTVIEIDTEDNPISLSTWVSRVASVLKSIVTDHATWIGAKADSTQVASDIAAAKNDLTAIAEKSDTDPYIYRASVANGDRVSEDIVGASVGWNQLVPNSGSSLSVTVQNGHKYVMKKSGTWTVGASTGTAITGLTGGSDMITDLSILWGTSIADSVYNMGNANGVAFFRKYFTASYYPYNAGELLSVEVEGKKYVGKNLFKLTPYSNWSTEGAYRVSDFVLPNARMVVSFKVKDSSINLSGCYLGFLSADWQGGAIPTNQYNWFINNGNAAPNAFNNATGDANAILTKIFMYPTDESTYNKIFQKYDIQIELGETQTTYEHYHITTYTFPAQTLRGLFTLVDGELKASGDVYGEDGTLERKFKRYNLGNYDWALGSSTNVRQAWYTNLVDIKKVSGATVFNGICVKFKAVAQQDSWKPYDMALNNYQTFLYICTNPNEYADATALKAALNGVYLDAEIETPITNQAEPLVMPQICDKNGTEEFVTTSIVPVGHESTYYNYPDYMEEGEYKDFRDRVDYAPEKAKWHQVGIYANGDTITIDGYHNEIMLVPNHYSGTTLLACASPAIFPFSLFKSITLQNSTESERIDITPAGVVGVTGTYFSNVTIFVR